MQTSKSRLDSLALPQKNSPTATMRTPRKLKTESETLSSPNPKTKITPKIPTPKLVTDRRSPRIPLNEIQKKRGGKIPELESQVSELQEELKKAKEELKRSEALKKEAEEEAGETKQQLMEMNGSEDSRIEELRKLSLERDKTWQSEVEAMQRQHGMDTAALSCALNEVQKLKSQLFESESSTIAKQALVEMLRSEAMKMSETGNSLRSELEKSKSQVTSLKKHVNELEEGLNQAREEIHQLKSAVEVAETRYQEEYIQSTLQIRSAYEQVEAAKSRYTEREAEIEKEVKQRLTMEEREEKESEIEKKMMNVEEVEAELKRVKVQCEQWRKAAETAASILSNEDKYVESPVRKNMNMNMLPYEDESDDESSPRKKNGNMLKKFGVLLKKNNK